jgi:hypothetical protein
VGRAEQRQQQRQKQATAKANAKADPPPAAKDDRVWVGELIKAKATAKTKTVNGKKQNAGGSSLRSE